MPSVALVQGQVLPLCKACARHQCLSSKSCRQGGLQKHKPRPHVVGSTSHGHKLLPHPAPTLKLFPLLATFLWLFAKLPFTRLWLFAASSISWHPHFFKALETLFTAKAASSSWVLAASMLTFLPCWPAFANYPKQLTEIWLGLCLWIHCCLVTCHFSVPSEVRSFW